MRRGLQPDSDLISLSRGTPPACILRKCMTASYPGLRERLSALALNVEGLCTKAVAQQMGRHHGTVEAWVPLVASWSAGSWGDGARLQRLRSSDDEVMTVGRRSFTWDRLDFECVPRA